LHREREQRQSKQHEADLVRTSTKGAKSRPGRTSPEHSPTKWKTSNHRGNTTNDRNEHGAVLRETLTRIITNGSGKPHQNTGQPSDAPQPRGQRNSNQKRAQHSTRRKVQSLRGIPRGLAKHNSQLTRVQELTTLALTAADNTRRHDRLRNSSDTVLPRRQAPS
ncbi:hypothetical protein Taro_022054, partial [Colocasia esculenta]|nr:hypothetical protein [Colocasia esculenta]